MPFCPDTMLLISQSSISYKLNMKRMPFDSSSDFPRSILVFTFPIHDSANVTLLEADILA